MEPLNSVMDEERRMRRLRILVDLTAAVLAQENLTTDEALDLINATKRTVLRLFPGEEQTYDIIYGRRFARILRERFESACREHNPAKEEIHPGQEPPR
jgi:hypothetical protein